MSDPATGTGLAATEEPAAVRLRGVTCRLRGRVAVQELDLSVAHGATFGLLGATGAGKSTTLALLATALRPTSGEVEVLGLDPVRQARHLRARIGWLPDPPGCTAGARVVDELLFAAAAHRLPRRDRHHRVEEMLDAVGLHDVRNLLAERLAPGQLRRLGLARALVHDPDLLLLDEPASDLEAGGRANLRQLLAALRAAGRTVVLSSHDLGDAQQFCEEVGVLHAGRLVAVGSPASMVAQLQGARRIRVRLASGVERVTTVAGAAAQAALLERLRAEGLDVVAVEEIDGDLAAAIAGAGAGETTR